jgi:hypothetical protein
MKCYVYRSSVFMNKCVWQTDHSWKHDHLRIHTATGGCDCSLKELLMMGTMVPETCWAASMSLNHKCYDWLVHLGGCFIWIVYETIMVRYWQRKSEILGEIWKHKWLWGNHQLAAVNDNERNTHFNNLWRISQENIYLQITQQYCLFSQAFFWLL